jgi:acyl-Coa thioesterase superfamily protein/acyl-CoA thioesterase superfamily protein
MPTEAVFTGAGGRFCASEFARGPWDPNAQHGGAPAALLMRAFEQHDADPGLMLARVTYELLRPVPLGQLDVTCSVLRPGRRVQLLEGSIVAADGNEVVRARALKVAVAGTAAGSADSAPPGPEGIEPSPMARWQMTTFPGDAMELRFVDGRFGEAGPATVWFRLRIPLIAGEEPSGLQRLAAAADFPNGIASELSWSDYVFINPDLTVYIERRPVGEWICLDARMRVVKGGLGFSEAVLYDRDGRVGRSLQSLYVAPRVPAT